MATWHVNREYEGIEISFDGKPSEEIRTKMKSAGFKWSSAQMKWYAKDTPQSRKVAAEVATQGEDVGEHLTFEQKMQRDKERTERRQERLSSKADKLEKKSEALLDQAHKMADVIPFGQPILVGHHSEGRDRRYRGRIHDKYGKAFEMQDEAKEVEQRLRGSERLSRKRETPGYMSRKIDTLEADLRKFEREKEQWKTNLPEWEKRTNDLEEQIAYWKKELEEVGGLKVTRDDVKVGDEILYLSTWYEVVRVNPKTVTIKNWLNVPTMTWGAEYSNIKAVRQKGSVSLTIKIKPDLQPLIDIIKIYFKEGKTFEDFVAGIGGFYANKIGVYYLGETYPRPVDWQKMQKDLNESGFKNAKGLWDYLQPKDTEFEKAKLFLSALAKAQTLDELIGWQPAVKHWSIKFPGLEKELESEYQTRFDYLKAVKETTEADKKEKASKPQSEQAKDLYKQLRTTNSVRELDDWRNRVLFEAHLPDVEEDILLRDLAAKWRVYLETRGIPALEKLDKLPLDFKDEDYYFGTEVWVHPTTTIFDDVPWKGIIHEARNGGELWEVARAGSEAEGTSRISIERIYITKLVKKPKIAKSDEERFKELKDARIRKENEELLLKEQEEKRKALEIEAKERAGYEFELNKLPEPLKREIEKVTALVLNVGKEDRSYADRYTIALGKMNDYIKRYVQPKKEEKTKFVVENPFRVDLSRSVVPYQEIPATESGKKLLQNPTPLTNEFIEWFRKSKGENFAGAKLSTFTDGEPYFFLPGIEGAQVTLRDYLKLKESKPASIPSPQKAVPEKLITLLKRYKNWQIKVDKISKETDAIVATSGMGQAPPVFHRLVDKQLDMVQKNLSPLWDEIKNYIIPNSDFKTFWQEISWTVGTLPPDYSEIEKVLNKYEVKIPMFEMKEFIEEPIFVPTQKKLFHGETKEEQTSQMQFKAPLAEGKPKPLISREEKYRKEKAKETPKRREYGLEAFGVQTSIKGLSEFEEKPAHELERYQKPERKPIVPASREQILKGLKLPPNPFIQPKPKLLLTMQDEKALKEAKRKVENSLLSRLDAIAEKTRLKREAEKLRQEVE